MIAFIRMLFSVFAQSITSVFFVLIILLTYVHIKKNAQLEESWLGFLRSSVSYQLMDVMLYGMLGGLIVSGLIALLGITLSFDTFFFIWPVALILMLFHRRYLCLSYAGGIVSLSSLLFGWPQIDVSAVIALVGILHLLESILILFDGHRDSLPVFMEHKEHGIMGAFIQNRLWPVPLVILIVPPFSLPAGAGIEMPDWWPLFKSQFNPQALMLFPIAAVLGYGDIAITQPPQERTRESGFWLAVYSLAILIIAIASSSFYWIKFLAALCAPVFHELLLYFGQKGQMTGKPAFGAPWRGLRVLDVFPESTAEVMGIKPGDILLSINGKDVNSQEMVDQIMGTCPSFLWVDVKRKKERLSLEHVNYKDGVENLGVLFVPRQTGRFFVIREQEGILLMMLKRLFKRKKERLTGGL